VTSLQFDYFDRMTPSYLTDRLQFAADEIIADGRQHPSILDIGCGDGSILDFLQSTGIDADFHGVDPAENYVALARGKGIEAVVGSVFDDETIEAHRGRHDYVVMASVLHHLVDERSWAECRRLQSVGIRNCLDMLVDDGKLLIYEPCTEPQIVNRVAFEIKSRVIRMGGNRRIDLAWMNFGAPLVAFFTPTDLQQIVLATGGTVLRPVDVGRRRMWPATRFKTGLVAGRRN
jgi:SAM-dependent methyltransferase